MGTLEISNVTDADRKAVAAIANEARTDFKSCYQCGKCTAGCPMVQGMDLMPREVIRYLQLGLIDEVLESRTPWVCAQCEVCSTRCPQKVDITSTMRAVRHAAMDAGHNPVPQAEIFEDAFVRNVAAHGRSNEQYLALKFNLRSGKLMQDVAHAPSMLSRGMIGIRTHNINSRGEVKDLIERTLRNGAAKKYEGTGDAK
jgi:heterodisulfide reductase subunit C